MPHLFTDQHVRQRRRAYRLQKVIGSNRKYIGVGLDEATWVQAARGKFKVHGKGRARVVTWLDGQIHTLKLRNGQTYDLAKRAKA